MSEHVQLITYKILFVKQSLEAVLLAEQEIVIEMSEAGSSFEAWKTAEFLQGLQHDPRPIPPEWTNGDEVVYPPEKHQTDCKHPGKTCYDGLPEDDKKYLRCFHQTRATSEQLSTSFQEQQANALREIAREIEKLE